MGRHGLFLNDSVFLDPGLSNWNNTDSEPSYEVPERFWLSKPLPVMSHHHLSR